MASDRLPNRWGIAVAAVINADLPRRGLWLERFQDSLDENPRLV
jgi:hypothetical protein